MRRSHTESACKRVSVPSVDPSSQRISSQSCNVCAKIDRTALLKPPPIPCIIHAHDNRDDRGIHRAFFHCIHPPSLHPFPVAQQLNDLRTRCPNDFLVSQILLCDPTIRFHIFFYSICTYFLMFLTTDQEIHIIECAIALS